jgi:hypothetical protein
VDPLSQGTRLGADHPPTGVLLHAKNTVMVLPVKHSPPSNPVLALEIPAETKRRLGLDNWSMSDQNDVACY